MNSVCLFNRRLLTSLSRQCRRLLSVETENTFTDRPRKEKCINKVTLLGRVGKEGEIRGTTEHPCLVFPLATNYTFRKSATGEYLTKTDWHRVCVFRPGLRNIASTIGRGDRILVEGSLSHQRFSDEDNKLVTVTSVIADEIVFLGRRATTEEEEDESGSL